MIIGFSSATTPCTKQTTGTCHGRNAHMSNTGKTKRIDPRQIEMHRKRKLMKLAERTHQANSQQRAAYARKVADAKLAEVQAKVANQEMSLTEAQGELIDITMEQYRNSRKEAEIIEAAKHVLAHTHDDDGTVEGCPGCFPGPDVSDWNSPEDSVYDG